MYGIYHGYVSVSHIFSNFARKQTSCLWKYIAQVNNVVFTSLPPTYRNIRFTREEHFSSNREKNIS
jgi:hypothetical protein